MLPLIPISSDPFSQAFFPALRLPALLFAYPDRTYGAYLLYDSVHRVLRTEHRAPLSNKSRLVIDRMFSLCLKYVCKKIQSTDQRTTWKCCDCNRDVHACAARVHCAYTKWLESLIDLGIINDADPNDELNNDRLQECIETKLKDSKKTRTLN